MAQATNTYSYSSIAYPGTTTYANGINDSGEVVGDYFNNGTITGFIDNNGTFTSVTYQNSPDTYLTGINASGQVVGHAIVGGNDQGFIYNSTNGSFTPLSYPGAASTDPQGINDAGQVVGTWNGNTNGSFTIGSFLYSNGAYSPVKSPADATGASTTAIGISNAGQISGSYIGDNIPGHSGQDLGFTDTNGSFTYLSEPGASDTSGHAISSTTGEVTGSASNNTGTTAFTESNGTYTTFAYPNATSTTLQGVNDSGQVVGQYTDSTGVHSFVATPQATVCFCSGTLIRTWRNGAELDVAVESLAVGDLAVTAAGQRRPVRWLGSRTLDCRRHPDPAAVLPVRIRAHALGQGRPARDLVVSPGHAVCVDLLGEVLVPASALVNGATVVQEDVARVCYWHVELDSHDLLLAEGLAAESYLDMGNRAFFAGQGVVDLAAGPDVAPGAAPAGPGASDPALRTHADFCRPFHDVGSPVAAFLRQRLHARALDLGWRLDDADPWAGAHLVVDGARVDGELDGLAARFALPAQARDVWLVSGACVPEEQNHSPDPRRLGLYVRALELDDGRGGPGRVGLDHPLLCAGWHKVEDGEGQPIRWTAGRARLPRALWAGCEGTLAVRVQLAMPALPRWMGPGEGGAAPGLETAAA